MAFAKGTWNMTHTDNLDEYMKTLGVGYLWRKVAATVKPTQQIEVDGDKWNIKTITTVGTREVNFTINQSFDEDTFDGRKTKTTVTLDGQKLIQDQKGTTDSVITRLFDGNTMTMTLTANGVTATRVYHRQDKGS